MKISIILSLALLASSAIVYDVIAEDRDPFEAGAPAPWLMAGKSPTVKIPESTETTQAMTLGSANWWG